MDLKLIASSVAAVVGSLIILVLFISAGLATLTLTLYRMYASGRGYGKRYDTNRPELYEEVKLYRNAREREQYDNMADLFALIQTLQCLEKAYIKDAVTAKEYTESCTRVLGQITAAFNLVKSAQHPDIPSFMKEYYLDCPAALQRIEEGKPITIQDNKGNLSKSIANVVSLFITLCDKLQMSMCAKDELYADLKDLGDIMDRMSNLPSDFEGKIKVLHWVRELDQLSASDSLTEEQVRQMVFDLESSREAFVRTLEY